MVRIALVVFLAHCQVSLAVECHGSLASRLGFPFGTVELKIDVDPSLPPKVFNRELVDHLWNNRPLLGRASLQRYMALVRDAAAPESETEAEEAHTVSYMDRAHTESELILSFAQSPLITERSSVGRVLELMRDPRLDQDARDYLLEHIVAKLRRTRFSIQQLEQALDLASDTNVRRAILLSYWRANLLGENQDSRLSTTDLLALNRLHANNRFGNARYVLSELLKFRRPTLTSQQIQWIEAELALYDRAEPGTRYSRENLE